MQGASQESQHRRLLVQLGGRQHGLHRWISLPVDGGKPLHQGVDLRVAHVTAAMIGLVAGQLLEPCGLVGLQFAQPQGIE